MAINILQQPGIVSFSGDPIIAKAKTTLTGKVFLNIALKCKVRVIKVGEENRYEEDYTYPISDDGIALFNVGNTLQTALGKYCIQEVKGDSISQNLYSAQFQLIYVERYLDGIQEVEGSTVVSEWYNAIMGSLTEYERISMPNADVSQIVSPSRILSRKPEGEIIPKGINLYIPAVSSESETIIYYTIQGEIKKKLSKFTGGIYVPSSLPVITDSLSLGKLRIDAGTEAGKLKYVTTEQSSMRHFLFLNGFGLIESITATVRESLKYSIDSEKYIIPEEINFNGYTRLVSYTQTPKVELTMSSGYVNIEWAEWWINEFVPTQKAWMQIDGFYIPVAIIPEDSNKLFDKSKPGMISVQFKVQYSFSGGTYNSFVR